MLSEAQFEAVFAGGHDFHPRLVAGGAVVRHQHAVTVGVVHVQHLVVAAGHHDLAQCRAVRRGLEDGAHDTGVRPVLVEKRPLPLERQELCHDAIRFRGSIAAGQRNQPCEHCTHVLVLLHGIGPSSFRSDYQVSM